MNNAKSIGIVAGWGEYPLAVARALREKGYDVVVAAVHGLAIKKQVQKYACWLTAVLPLHWQQASHWI